MLIFQLTIWQIQMIFSLKPSSSQGELSLKISARLSSSFRRSWGTSKQTDSFTHWQNGAFIEWFDRIIEGPRIGSLSVYGWTSKRSLSTIQNFNCLLIWYYLLTPRYKRFFLNSTYNIFDNLSISNHSTNIEASLSIVCMNCCEL